MAAQRASDATRSPLSEKILGPMLTHTPPLPITGTKEPFGVTDAAYEAHNRRPVTGLRPLLMTDLGQTPPGEGDVTQMLVRAQLNMCSTLLASITLTEEV